MKSTITTFSPHRVSLPSGEKIRGSAASRGYGRRWQKARAAYLAENPVCQCGDPECQRPATEVHHIKAHRGDYNRFWDVSNWQGLTKECHSRLTAKEGPRRYS